MVGMIAEARKWLVDAMVMSDADATALSDGQVVLMVNRVYDGAWEGFENDHRALLSD
jgi:hypothetical protein